MLGLQIIGGLLAGFCLLHVLCGNKIGKVGLELAWIGGVIAGAAILAVGEGVIRL